MIYTLPSPEPSIVSTACMKLLTDIELRTLFSDERAASEISSVFVSVELLPDSVANLMSWVITSLVEPPSVDALGL